MFVREQKGARRNFSFSSASNVPVFISLALFLATMAVYWPVLKFDFVDFDDPDYFANNPHVLNGLNPANMVWAFTTGCAANWHPLTWLSLMLDADLFGKGPWGPHLTNLLLHSANTVVLFLFLRNLTGTMWRSAAVAALFAWHPLHVESVAWVSERKDVLSTFFGLGSLWFYVKYARSRTPLEGGATGPLARFPVVSLVAAWLFLLLGLMAKPMLVTLPLVMLLIDWWPLQRFANRGATIRLAVEKIPFLLLSIGSSVVTYLVQAGGGAVAALTTLPVSVRIENAFVAYIRYLGKTFWPVDLANPYPLPGHWPMGLVVSTLFIFVLLSAVVAWLGRNRGFIVFGWLWFVGMLIPVIGLVQVGDAAMADRYTYLPLVGIFIIVSWTIGEAFIRWQGFRPLLIFLTVALLGGCVWRMREQLWYWQDSGVLFRHTLAVTSDNYVAYNDLGTWLNKRGELGEAVNCFNASILIKPENPEALFNLGNVGAKQRNWDEAIGCYQQALKITPARADILNNLGLVMTQKGDYAGAIADFETALRVAPDSASAYNNLGTVRFIQGDYQESARAFYHAVSLEPDNPLFFINFGDALAKLGDVKAALESYQQALQLDPGNALAGRKLQALGAVSSNPGGQ